MSGEWFVGFFDELYYETYKVFLREDRSEREARFIVEALGVPPGSRVLDLACGYARHASYLARWGYHVTCYDLSLFLLGKGRERLVGFGIDCCVELVNGDMRFVSLRDEAFDAVVSFFTSFGYFGDRGDLETLAEVSRVLRRGGRFLLDVNNPVLFIHDHALEGGSRKTWFVAGDYLVLEESVYDPLESIVRVRRVFYRHGREYVGERSFMLRVYTFPELKSMLETVGLRVVRVYGSTRGDPYTAKSPRLVVVAAKD